MRLDLALKPKSKAIEAMPSAKKLMAQLHASSALLGSSCLTAQSVGRRDDVKVKV